LAIVTQAYITQQTLAKEINGNGHISMFLMGSSSERNSRLQFNLYFKQVLNEVIL